MRQYYYIIAFASAVLSLASCKTDTGFAEAEGSLKLSIGVSDKVNVVSRSLASEEQEVRATIAHLTRRISGIAAAIAGLNRSLEQFDTAQTRLPLEGGDAVE